METSAVVKCFILTVAFATITAARDNVVKTVLEKVSGSDLLDLLENCNSSTPIWIFSTMDQQLPLFFRETESLCRHRLMHNSFFWASIDVEKVSKMSTKDHFVFCRKIDYLYSSFSGESVELPDNESQYKVLIEVAQEDSMDDIKVLQKKKIGKKLKWNAKSPKIIALRHICVHFDDQMKLRRNLDKNFDLCFMNKAMYQIKDEKWIADVQIPVKSDTFAATLVVPSIAHLMPMDEN